MSVLRILFKGSKKTYPIIEHIGRMTAKPPERDSKACCKSTTLSLLTLKSTSQDIQLKEFVEIVKRCISNLLRFVPSFLLEVHDSVKTSLIRQSLFFVSMASMGDTFRATGTEAGERLIRENFHVGDNYGDIFVYLVFANLYLNKLIEKATSHNLHDDDSSEEYEEQMENPVLTNLKQRLAEMSKILDAVFQSYQLGTGKIPELHFVKKICKKAVSNFARMKPYDIRNIFQTVVGTKLELSPRDFIYCTLGLKTSSRHTDFSFGMFNSDPEMAMFTLFFGLQPNLDSSWWLWMIRNKCCSYSDWQSSDSDLASGDENVTSSEIKTKAQKPEAAIPKLEEIFQEVGFTPSRAALLESWIEQNRFNEHELLAYWAWKHLMDTFKYSILLKYQCPTFPYFEDSINVWQTVKGKYSTMMEQESSKAERASDVNESKKGAQKTKEGSSDIEINEETKHLKEEEDKDAQRLAQRPNEAICNKEEKEVGQNIETKNETQRIAEERDVMRTKQGTIKLVGENSCKVEHDVQQAKEATCDKREQNRIPQTERPHSVKANEGAELPDGAICIIEEQMDAKQGEGTGSIQEFRSEKKQQGAGAAKVLQGSENEDCRYGAERSRVSPLLSTSGKVWGSKAARVKGKKSGKEKGTEALEIKKTSVAQEETDGSEEMGAAKAVDAAVEIKAADGRETGSGSEAGSGKEAKAARESRDFDVLVINKFFTPNERYPKVIYNHGESFENELNGLWYHGTNHRDAVNIINKGIKLELGGERKDFSDGNGFYLFATYEDAVDWARGIEGGMHAAVVIFKFNKGEFKGVEVGKDAAWQYFVKYYRSKPLPGRFGNMHDEKGPPPKILEGCDYIEGPMAKVRNGAELIKGGFQAYSTSQMCIRSAKMAERVGMLINAVIFFSNKK